MRLPRSDARASIAFKSNREPVVVTSLSESIRAALMASVPFDKIMATRRLARDWRCGRLVADFSAVMPDRPGRPERPELLAASQMPSRRKAGSLANRVTLLHALAHIEFVAIDLALDMAGRFGGSMPRAFVDDWLSVAADEAMHFALLERRLVSLGSHYGALPAHDGLWEAAQDTAGDVGARLAIVPMVLEARGLDVTPATIARLEAAGDRESARILARIYRDEIRHVAVGSRWFAIHCDSARLDPASHWKSLVRRHFRGALKPPFNDSARGEAGLPREFYMEVASLNMTRHLRIHRKG